MSPPTVSSLTAMVQQVIYRFSSASQYVEAIRAVWPADRPLFARLSCVDGEGGHWDLSDTIAFASGFRPTSHPGSLYRATNRGLLSAAPNP